VPLPYHHIDHISENELRIESDLLEDTIRYDYITLHYIEIFNVA